MGRKRHDQLQDLLSRWSSLARRMTHRSRLAQKIRIAWRPQVGSSKRRWTRFPSRHLRSTGVRPTCGGGRTGQRAGARDSPHTRGFLRYPPLWQGAAGAIGEGGKEERHQGSVAERARQREAGDDDQGAGGRLGDDEHRGPDADAVEVRARCRLNRRDQRTIEATSASAISAARRCPQATPRRGSRDRGSASRCTAARCSRPAPRPSGACRRRCRPPRPPRPR